MHRMVRGTEAAIAPPMPVAIRMVEGKPRGLATLVGSLQTNF
jgi:hypothetical protein